MTNIQVTQEILDKCPVKRGVKGSPAPIPQEGSWTKCKEIKDISVLLTVAAAVHHNKGLAN